MIWHLLGTYLKTILLLFLSFPRFSVIPAKAGNQNFLIKLIPPP